MFAVATGVASPCLGASTALRRKTLEAIGGIAALADYLVEDFEMGARIRARGQRGAVLPYLVDTSVDVRLRIARLEAPALLGAEQPRGESGRGDGVRAGARGAVRAPVRALARARLDGARGAGRGGRRAPRRGRAVHGDGERRPRRAAGALAPAAARPGGARVVGGGAVCAAHDLARRRVRPGRRREARPPDRRPRARPRSPATTSASRPS